ncbi:hypothetical protein J7J62_07365, partial [bacterium]|nr:hypothetical protein [bacterium]
MCCKETNKINCQTQDFHKKQHRFGTLALITNLEKVSAEKIFQYFKSRVEIEQMFDTFKNT